MCALALVAAFASLSPHRCAGLGCEADKAPMASVESYLTPRPPELPEVASSRYYTAFEPLPWPRAEELVRQEKHMWIEETQSGRVYLTFFQDSAERKVRSALPRAADLDALVAELKSHGDRSIKHMRYQELRWPQAMALIRGADPEHVVASVGAMHFDRVFLTTTRGAWFLAIQPTPDALTDALRQAAGPISLTVE
jgi:hypothetical protein